MTRILNPGRPTGDDQPPGADPPTRPPIAHPKGDRAMGGCATSLDLKDTIAVAIMVHGLPEVERALAHFRRRLNRDPATAFDDPRPKRTPRPGWGEPPYPRPEETTCR